MIQIVIEKADCDTNETFEAYVESVGLSCFENNGDPKDVEHLSLEAELVSDSEDHVLIISRADLDDSTFENICQKLEVIGRVNELIVRYRNPVLK